MNSFGRIFRVHIFGESHGEAVGVLVDGCPAGLPLEVRDFQEDLERRKGPERGTTARREPDRPRILSGLNEGKTTGAPLAVLFENLDVRSEDYEGLRFTPRPGHADFAAFAKFGGFHDHRGGGHFSGRLTLGLTAAGVIAKKIVSPVEIQARLVEAGGDRDVERAVDKALAEGDSIGGIVECEARRVPAGLGEPFFDSLESLVSHLIFAIPGIKAVEFGAGFGAARMTGSAVNDPIVDSQGTTSTNRAGGVNGGISNGNPVVFRVAMRPTPTISKPQGTVDLKTGKPTEIIVGGRHDACIALRVPVIVEAAAAIVLADLLLLEQKRPRVIK